jgi:spore coat protein CotF
MNLVYYSQYKGTAADGVTKKIILDTLTDLPNFMQFYPDFINMVALRAAYILMPQLSGDENFMKMYNDDYQLQLKDWGKVYPRKRSVNLGQTQLRRP